MWQNILKRVELDIPDQEWQRDDEKYYNESNDGYSINPQLYSSICVIKREILNKDI